MLSSTYSHLFSDSTLGMHTCRYLTHQLVPCLYNNYETGYYNYSDGLYFGSLESFFAESGKRAIKNHNVSTTMIIIVQNVIIAIDSFVAKV